MAQKLYRVEIILAEYEGSGSGEPVLKDVLKTHPLSGKVHTKRRWAENEFDKYMNRYSRTRSY